MMDSLPPGEPKFRRRPDARPGEILASALDVFAEQGFAATRMEEVARRAGVSKGAVYLYFPTKAELLSAVVRDTVLPTVDQVKRMTAEAPSFAAGVRLALPAMAERLVHNPRMTGVVRLIIAESRTRPELAELWYAEVVAPALAMLTGLIEQAQAKGEVRAGEARLFAMGLMGPMVLSMLWRETFQPVGAPPVDAVALARQHVETVIRGMQP